MRPAAPRQEGFPARLQTLADRAGSINDLAIAGQVPVKTLSDWLRGVRKPHATSLTRFARNVGVSLTWLRDGVGPEVEAPDDLDLVPLDQGRSLLKISRAWAQAWLRAPALARLVVVHALPGDAVPGKIEADEPVVFAEVERDFRPAPGVVILIEDHMARERIAVTGSDGDFPGRIRGVALWTGHRLNLGGKGSY